MNNSKPWYLSKTIWAAIITILAPIAGIFGMPVDAIDNAALAETILQAITALSGIVAIFSRVYATEVIR